jgi:hypothetical protein
MMETDYLTFEEASTFIEECEEGSVIVLGIERFSYNNGSITPDLEGIADFSMLPADRINEAIDLSKKFLNLYGRGADERFTIVTAKAE